MQHAHLLFGFIQKLIAIQIKKYVDLTEIGIGPDASINASLVHDQVEDLLCLSQQLLDRIEMARKESKNVDITDLFNQMRFYLEQEFTRGKAGYLLDQNQIHSGEMDRLNDQLTFVKSFASQHRISIIEPTKPTNQMQERCLHDSHAIAAFILNLAIQVKSDPEMEFSHAVPAHAIKILRKHGKQGGRYHQPEIYEEIERMFNVSNDFLATSTLEKRTDKLCKEEAKLEKIRHETILNALQAKHDSLMCKTRNKHVTWQHYGLFALSTIAPPLILLLQKYLSYSNSPSAISNENLTENSLPNYQAPSSSTMPW